MAGLRRTGSLLVIALIPWVLMGCASTSSRLAKLHKSSADSQDQIWTRAQLCENEGQFAQAQQLYAELCRLEPQSPIYAHRLGVVSTMLSDHERAHAAYERAKELDPNDAELLTDMGYSAYLQRDYEQAETLLQASLAKVADNPRAKTNLALAIGCQGRYDEAVVLFREVHGQDEAEVLCNLAYVKSQRGEVVEATKIYKQVLAIDPKFAKASTALAQLKSPEASEQSVAQAKPYHKYMNKPQLPAVKPAAPAAVEADMAFVAAESETVQQVDAGLASPIPSSFAEVLETSVIQTGEQVVQEFEVPDSVALDDPAPWSEPESDLKPLPLQAESRQFPQEATETLTPVQIHPLSQKLQVKAIAVSDTVMTVTSKPVAVTVTAPAEIQTTTSADAPRELTDGWVAAQTSIVEQFGPEWLSTREEQIQARSGQSGFMGFCPVALRDEMKLVDALPQYAADHQSQRFQFSSEEAAKKFLANPERYLPSAGGLDVVAVSQGTAVAQGSLEHALWFRKKLYLFLNRENMELFRTQAREFAVQD